MEESFKTWLHQHMLADLYEGEQCFPTYHLSAKWVEDIGDRSVSSYGPDWFKGLPAGRLHNGSSSTLMFREVRDLEDIEKERFESWLFPETTKNPSDLDVIVSFGGWEVWCPSWFSHWTFDVGMDDAAVLASFHRYVDRMKLANERWRYNYGTPEHEEHICLMGAEDRWRWHGGDGEHTEPPCRCEHCKKLGLIRIDH